MTCSENNWDDLPREVILISPNFTGDIVVDDEDEEHTVIYHFENDKLESLSVSSSEVE